MRRHSQKTKQIICTKIIVKKYKSPNNFSLNKYNNCVTRLAIPWTAMTGCQYWVSWKSWEGSTEIIKIELIIQN